MAVFGQQNGLNLTGFWQDNAGGKFAIRQVGNQIFWLDDSRPKYVNSLFGTISGNTIHAQWADLPGGTMQHSGTLDLRVESNDRMVKTGSTGTPFGGSVFTRVGASTAASPAPNAVPGSDRARTAPPAIVGNWQWTAKGATVTVKPDGTFTGAGSGGRWTMVDQRNQIYDLNWSNGTVDHVELSSDGQHLQDSNPFNRKIIASRAK